MGTLRSRTGWWPLGGALGRFSVMASGVRLPLAASCQVFNGLYGAAEHESGRLLAVTVSAPEPSEAERLATQYMSQEIILVADTSSSMRGSIAMLQCSLLAFRDLLLQHDPTRCVACAQGTCDTALERRLRERFRLTLIDFSNRAKVVYSHADLNLDFTAAVRALSAGGGTNIPLALQTAFTARSHGTAGVIVFLTDGQSEEELAPGLLAGCPPRTRTIALGYGESFDAQALTLIGEYTHISSEALIPEVFGALALEISETVVADGRLDFRAADNSMRPYVPVAFLAGSAFVGSLHTGRQFTAAFLLLPGEAPPIVSLTWTDVAGRPQSLPATVVAEAGETIAVPAPVRLAYFWLRAGQLVASLRQSFSTALDAVTAELAVWPSPLADGARAAVMSIVRRAETHRDIGNAALAMEATSVMQTSLLECGEVDGSSLGGSALARHFRALAVRSSATQYSAHYLATLGAGRMVVEEAPAETWRRGRPPVPEFSEMQIALPSSFRGSVDMNRTTACLEIPVARGAWRSATASSAGSSGAGALSAAAASAVTTSEGVSPQLRFKRRAESPDLNSRPAKRLQ
eukprot:c5989_g1_i1.p1 GENE.c5989_g1_i1~~c5989_g1_i1.p1  ORF type:complete len:576 (+),score=48.46 c5989_g1_i1:2-1729(+)